MPNSVTNPLNHPIVSGSGNPAYTVVASQESDNLVSNSGPGCAPLDGYSELMDNTGLGGLPCRTQLIISANGKSIQAQKCDSGHGSSFQPVMGLYPRVSEFLFGTRSGGEFHVTIQRVDGKPLHPTIGTPASAVAGGTAGLGGTGTAGNSKPQSNFMVGDTSNPHEDYWTAINRLSQDRAWYVFSDGETLYLADGPDLMAQDPVATVDRVADADRIQSLGFTWDNTAFQYAVNHKRRHRIQRRSTVAKVSSPVQAVLELICDIDEVRAGDVLIISGCGPGDGRWLVGECERSIFSVYSTITLVPALSPLTEQQVAGAGSKSSTTKGTGGSNSTRTGTPTGNFKGLSSPFTKKLRDPGLGGTDMGVDLGGADGFAPGDPLLAIGDCHYRGKTDFYQAQPGMWFELVDKSAGYWGFYFSEQVTPVISPSGSLVPQGTIVARYASSGTATETGWAAGVGQTATQANHPNEVAGRHAGGGTTDGRAWRDFLLKVGAIG